MGLGSVDDWGAAMYGSNLATNPTKALYIPS